MASWQAKDAAGSNEVLQLLEEYCNKRSKQVLLKRFMSCCVRGAFLDEPSTHDDMDRMFSGKSPQANMDDIIQRLVELIKVQGDDIDKKIKQNMDLQVKDLDYNMFKELTSSMQNLVNEGEASEVQVQRQKIALVFEVTSRLSALNLVYQRRILSFGAQYIQETHLAWVEQHRGWAEAFSID